MNIRQLITRADIPNLTTMLGNIGNSWYNSLPNDLFIRAVPKCILRAVADPKLTNGGNVGAGLDVIHTYSLPSDSLKSDGDILNLWYEFNFAANNNDKRIDGTFGGNNYFGMALIDVDGGGGILNVNITRLTSTSVRIGFFTIFNFLHADSAAPPVMSSFTTGAYHDSRAVLASGLSDMDTNNTTIELRAEGTANDDITVSTAIFHLTRF